MTHNDLCRILDTENQINIFKRELSNQIEVMGMVDVNDIIDGLDVLYSELLPVSEKYLPNIDNQSKLTVLFCNNYVYTLIKMTYTQDYEKNRSIKLH